MNYITKVLSILLLLQFNSALANSPLINGDTPLDIILIGHPTLLLQAEKLDESEVSTEKFQKFIDDMMVTMKKAGGVGLAGPQVNISKRLFVIKPSVFKKAEVMINPVIEYLEDKGKKMSTEGCLSIPGKQFSVERYKEINIRYEDRHGNTKYEHAKGFRAIVMQHEYDHLNGVLISDIFYEKLDLKEYFGKSIPKM